MTITPQSAYGTAKFIVSATAGQGNYTTIQAAITAASSGDTIFVRPGTYTENPSLKAGVLITAYTGDVNFLSTANPIVIILGKCTYSSAGATSISNICLKTNSDYALSVTGSSGSSIDLTNCYIDGNNNTAIQVTGTAVINLTSCLGSLDTTGIAFYTSSSSGGLSFFGCNFSNSGSTTASSNSAGSVNFHNSLLSIPLSCSSTGTILVENCSCEMAALNTTFITTAGTGTSTVRLTRMSTGTASAISVGSGSTLEIANCIVSSSNTNAITGAGTLNYGVVTFDGSSSTINTTTTNPLTTLPSSGGSITIDGDSGSASGSTITFNANSNAGSSVSFSASGSTVDFNVTDSNNLTIVGKGAGNGSISSPFGSFATAFGQNTLTNLTTGFHETAIGYAALNAVVTGSSNTAVGYEALTATLGAGSTAVGAGAGAQLTTGPNTIVGSGALGNCLTGTQNIVIGSSAGTGYTSSESTNILIGNVGNTGESSTIHIGNAQTSCFIAGITGTTPTSANTPQVVLCDSTGNLTVIDSSTSGYVLTSNGTSTPSFQAAGGGGAGSKVLIQSITASSSATIDFTSGVTGYSYYYIDFFDVVTSHNNDSMILQTHSGGSFQTTGYDYAFQFNYAQTTSITVQNSTSDTSILIAEASGSSSTSALNGEIYCYSIGSSTLYKRFLYNNIGAQQGQVTCINSWGGGTWENAAVVDGFRLSMLLGNFTSGTFRLFGVV